MQSPTRGKFIVFEGGDGAGKDTQVNLLKERFSADDVVFTREPGGTGMGKKIRELLLNKDSSDILPKTELLLYYADRAQHIDEVIAPALSAGKHVISNRFALSTIAYQIYGRERMEYLDFLLALDQHVIDTYTPDLYIFLDVDPREGLRRVGKRGEKKDRMEKEAREFHDRVREGYLKHLKRHNHFIIGIDERGIEEVNIDVVRLVEAFLR